MPPRSRRSRSRPRPRRVRGRRSWTRSRPSRSVPTIAAKLKAEIDSIGEDRRKLNALLIGSAAKIRAVEERIAAAEARPASAAKQREHHPPLARKPQSRDRRGAGSLAANRPQPAARPDGQPGRRAAIGAHRDFAGRRAARHEGRGRHAGRRPVRVSASTDRNSRRTGRPRS